MEFAAAPDNLDLRSAEVHVWRAVLETVPADLTLRQVLALYLDQDPEEIELERGKHGKPRLAEDPPRLAFNLSHSGDLALVAVARDREVGVDVERVKPERDLVALAERALTPEAAAAVRKATEPERAHLFYELWTRHEARLKCLGVGLATQPTWPPPPVAVQALPIDGGFAAAIAVSGDPVPIRCWTFG
ncbi:MAG TPA: 4'-phosphopantetheinyl transferase superfamily protein [Solirubrobacterales bacterium]|nr:4'-phosphopantetheinyl transferase superfamily protein [Solirubrobacterales bacterium]